MVKFEHFAYRIESLKPTEKFFGSHNF